jgi:hypothetical protein
MRHLATCRLLLRHFAEHTNTGIAMQAATVGNAGLKPEPRF